MVTNLVFLNILCIHILVWFQIKRNFKGFLEVLSRKNPGISGVFHLINNVEKQMQDIKLLKQYLYNMQEAKKHKTKYTGFNIELTPEAAARNVMHAISRGKSPVEGLVHPHEADEFKKDFPNRIN